ncbi:hypothetical protein KI387_002498 [Taxus chinensis]|uniref:Uncharacterized protein n=1 Tax=Taxus chinensis TaxID=29808 RepID=A0AA38H0Z8_TAXCH|nr:hypothetical protein KI387_002498 [Taxus chinensis]
MLANLLQSEIHPKATTSALTPSQCIRSASIPIRPPLLPLSSTYGRGKMLMLPNAGMSMRKTTHNFTTFEFPSFTVDGMPSARGTSVLNIIDLNEEYLGFDIYYYMQESGRHAEDLTQSFRKQMQPLVGSSYPPSPTGKSQEKMDDDAKTSFSLDILVSENATTLLMENVIPNSKELKIWEIKVKSLIKEINDRYHNFENRENIFSLVKNQPVVIDGILAQAKKLNAITDNVYNRDEVLTIMLNRLADLNFEAQSYYNKWNRDKHIISIVNAEKDLIVVLDEHLKKHRESVHGAIGFKEKLVMFSKQNNTLRRIIKEHNMDSEILLKKKIDEDPSILSTADATREDRENLEKMNVNAKELVESGVIQDSSNVVVVKSGDGQGKGSN